MYSRVLVQISGGHFFFLIWAMKVAQDSVLTIKKKKTWIRAMMISWCFCLLVVMIWLQKPYILFMLSSITQGLQRALLCISIHNKCNLIKGFGASHLSLFYQCSVYVSRGRPLFLFSRCKNCQNLFFSVGIFGSYDLWFCAWITNIHSFCVWNQHILLNIYKF